MSSKTKRNELYNKIKKYDDMFSESNFNDIDISALEDHFQNLLKLNSNKVLLKCVKENGKLRIKFHSFVNKDGIGYTKSYNTDYNCLFPKNIREEGVYYEILDTDITLSYGQNNNGFYRINKKNIKVLEKLKAEDIIKNMKIFEVNECVICLSEEPSLVFVPCGHVCCCSGCFSQLKNEIKCPLCRRKVLEHVERPSA